MRDTTQVYFDSTKLDEAGKASFNAAFPALYKTTETIDLVPNQDNGKLTVADSSRIFAIIDQDSVVNVQRWSKLNATTIRNVWSTKVSTYSYAPFNYPTSGSVVIPDEWLDALLIYGQLWLVENLMDDMAKFRGYQPNSEMNVSEGELANTAGQLYRRWQDERDEHAMALPVARV